MTKKSKYLEKLLEVQNEHQKMMHNIVVDAIREQEGLVNKLHEDEKNLKSSFGEKISDKIASFGGSWKFIFMGANQDAIQTASEFNIQEESSLTFDTANVNDAFRSASHAIQRSQTAGVMSFTPVERTRSCPHKR